jgi:glutathione S-transferase
MLIVHHLNNSRSHRIVWLCEEPGIDCELVKHLRDPDSQRAPDSLKQVHPLGKAPLIEHNGQMIGESEAIIEYTCNVCAEGRLSVPPTSPEYGPYQQWLAFSEGSLFPGLLVDLVDAWTGRGNPDLMGFFDVETAKNHRFVEDALTGQHYLLPSGFSAADVNLGWALEFSECRGWLRDYPALQAYVERLRARPGYGKAISSGGPQDLSVFSAGAR